MYGVKHMTQTRTKQSTPIYCKLSKRRRLRRVDSSMVSKSRYHNRQPNTKTESACDCKMKPSAFVSLTCDADVSARTSKLEHSILVNIPPSCLKPISTARNKGVNSIILFGFKPPSLIACTLGLMSLKLASESRT